MKTFLKEEFICKSIHLEAQPAGKQPEPSVDNDDSEKSNQVGGKSKFFTRIIAIH